MRVAHQLRAYVSMPASRFLCKCMYMCADASLYSTSHIRADAAHMRNCIMNLPTFLPIYLICICVRVCVYIYIYTCTYVCVRLHIHMCLNMHMNMYLNMYMNMHMHMYICICMCINTYIYICMYALYVFDVLCTEVFAACRGCALGNRLVHSVVHM